MGFSIGGLLGGIADVFSTVSSPLGNVIGGAARIASSALTPVGSPPGRATTPAPQVASTATQSAPVSVQNVSRGITPARFSSGANRFGAPSTNIAALGSLGRVGGAVAGVGVVEGISRMFGGDNGVSEILKEARENVRGATKNKIIDAAKSCGIELAANTFGISESQVCVVIVNGRTRRRRGISAADIRRTKRVIRFNKRLTKDLKVR